jgi:hypothetical protein
MNIYVRFILGMLSIVIFLYLAFNPIFQPWNTLVLIAAGANVGWQIMALWTETKKDYN